jgi:hypothetical protein
VIQLECPVLPEADMSQLLKYRDRPRRDIFPGPSECASKKQVWDHDIYTSFNERLPQARYDSFEQHILITAHFAPLFVTRHFLKLRGLAGRAA